MKYFLQFLFLIAAMSAIVSAQDRDKPRANGFAFVAPGSRVDTGSTTFEIGGGGEGYIYKGLGLEFDLGAIQIKHTAGAGGWTGMVSFNGLYNFNANDKSQFSPFILGGVVIMPRIDTPGGVDFGGGATYWFGKRAGLRMEIRDNVFVGDRAHHYFQARIGISFR